MKFDPNPPAIIRQAHATIEQLKMQFDAAMHSVAANRKQIYLILVDLKEHYHEYGFNCPRAAVEVVCNRSKTWANDFMAQVEAEAEIDQVTGTPVASPDTHDRKEQKALSQVEEGREVAPEPEETIPDFLQTPKPQNNGHVRTENGKSKRDLAIWKEIEESLFGRAINRTDELNRQCPNDYCHKRLIGVTKVCLQILEEWRNATR